MTRNRITIKARIKKLMCLRGYAKAIPLLIPAALNLGKGLHNKWFSSAKNQCTNFRRFIALTTVLVAHNNNRAFKFNAALPPPFRLSSSITSNGQLKEILHLELTFVGHRRVVGLQVLGGHFDASWKVLDVLHGRVHADVQSVGEGDRGSRVPVLHWQGERGEHNRIQITQVKHGIM